MHTEFPFIVVITGPTGSGKSRLGLSVAQALGGEIVSADSVQIYRGFDIGSAKPGASDLAAVPHHLISELSPADPFDAAQFAIRASEAIRQIHGRKRLPIVVGGTGLYLRALLGGMVAVPPVSAAATALFNNRVEQLEASGADQRAVSQELHRWLQEIDPRTAAGLSSTDSQRVRRALQVALSGVSLHELQSQHQHSDWRFSARIFALLPPREPLYSAIDARVESMFVNGFVEEVRSLRAEGFAGTKPMASIGYREVNAFLDGACSEGEAKEHICRATRHFAKRQYTWWRHQPSRLGWTVEESAGQQIVKPVETERAVIAEVTVARKKSEEIVGPDVQFRRLEHFIFGDSIETVIGKPDRYDGG